MCVAWTWRVCVKFRIDQTADMMFEVLCARKFRTTMDSIAHWMTLNIMVIIVG